MCNTVQECGFCSYRFTTLFKLLLYFTVILNQAQFLVCWLWKGPLFFSSNEGLTSAGRSERGFESTVKFCLWRSEICERMVDYIRIL